MCQWADGAKAPNPNAVAVGFTHKVWSFTSNNWSNAFFSYLDEGTNVEDAVDACNAWYNPTSSVSGIYYGNGSYTLN